MRAFPAVSPAIKFGAGLVSIYFIHQTIVNSPNTTITFVSGALLGVNYTLNRLINPDGEHPNLTALTWLSVICHFHGMYQNLMHQTNGLLNLWMQSLITLLHFVYDSNILGFHNLTQAVLCNSQLRFFAAIMAAFWGIDVSLNKPSHLSANIGALTVNLGLDVINLQAAPQTAFQLKTQLPTLLSLLGIAYQICTSQMQYPPAFHSKMLLLTLLANPLVMLAHVALSWKNIQPQTSQNPRNHNSRDMTTFQLAQREQDNPQENQGEQEGFRRR